MKVADTKFESESSAGTCEKIIALALLTPRSQEGLSPSGNRIGLLILCRLIKAALSAEGLLGKNVSSVGEINRGAIIANVAETGRALNATKRCLEEVGLLGFSALFYFCDDELIWRSWHPVAGASVDVMEFFDECVERQKRDMAAIEQRLGLDISRGGAEL